MTFLSQNRLETINHTHIGGETRLFTKYNKTATILDLWAKYGSNFLENPKNKFLDPKSHRKHKLHIPMR